MDRTERRLTGALVAVVGGGLLLRVLAYAEVIDEVTALLLVPLLAVPVLALARHVAKEEDVPVRQVLRRGLPGRR